MTLDVPLWPTVWSIEPGHRVVVRLTTQPSSDDCGNLLGVPVGCNPTGPMQTSLAGGVYTVSRGSGSFVHLPLLDYGALPTAERGVSPTAPETTPPLPIDW